MSPWTQKRTSNVPDEWIEIVADLLQRPWITADELRTRNETGLFAVEDYLRWLERLPSTVHSNHELLDRETGQLLGITEGRRKEVYQQILNFLGPSPGKPVLIVHQEAMQVGMTALASSLCSHLAMRDIEPDLPFVYLPLHPHGPPEAKERVTLPMLIGWLKAFYKGESLARAISAANLQSMRVDSAAIRRAMSEHPIVIILDGHRSPGQRLPYLHAAMIDDPLLPLLEELIHPRHATNQPSPDPAITGRSRILVLSDQDVHHHVAFRRESIVFPLPADRTLDRLLAELRPDVPPLLMRALRQANSCCSDVGLQLFITMAERLPESQWPTGIEGLYDTYCARLDEEDSAAMALLYLVAMTYDGLQAATLRRLIGQMAACHARQALRMPWLDLDEDGLEKALGRLRDDKVIEPVTETGQDGGPAVLHDVVASGLRQAIVTRLFQRDKESLVLAHRLIAEEALRQHTSHLAVSDWLDRFDSRSRRRLYQFFYHAFLSLEDGPAGRIDRLDAVSHVLPAANEETYRRLYAVFFRTLTEEPAVLELSRVLGRDGLKSDLLTLASRAGIVGFARDVLDRSNTWLADKLGPFARRYDWSCRTSALAIQAMVTDLRWNRARAEFNIRHSLPSLPDTAGSTGAPSAAARAKLSLDLDIELAKGPAQYRSVIIRAQHALEAAGLTRQGQIALDHLASGVVDINFVLKVDAMVAQWANAHSDAAQLAAWSDLLCRIGEARQLLAGLNGTSKESAPRLVEAFVNLFAAERLRRAAFDAGPLGRDYIVNGRSTRVFVRICLQLVLAGRVAGSSAIPEEFLVGQADRHIDIVTRYFARFPSESAAIHVLRAQRERIVGHGNRVALDQARRWLELADEMMWYARDRQTVRMMLLLERCAVYRSLARITARPERDRFHNSALDDAKYLKWMSNELSLGIWTRAATRTIERLQNLTEDLANQAKG